MNRTSPSPSRATSKSSRRKSPDLHGQTEVGLAGVRARSARSGANRPKSAEPGLSASLPAPGAESAHFDGEAQISSTHPDPDYGGMQSVMTNWVEGGESNIHSIVETLRSCVESGELDERTPLRLEIEACAASRPSLSLRGGLDKYYAHFMQFKKVIARMQRGAGRALRRRCYVALQHCTLMPVPEPRLYSFEVSLSWSHNGAEYRVSLFSKLKSKDWPNPASLLGTLAEVLHFLHTGHTLHTVAQELIEDQRRVSSQKTTLEHDLQLQRDATHAAGKCAQAAEREAIRLRETLLDRDATIAVLVAEDTYTVMNNQIQKLKEDNLQLGADLATANTKIGEMQSEMSRQVEEMEKFKAKTHERETIARNSYNESLKFFEEDCKMKLQELDERYTEIEHELISERIVSEQMRAQLDRVDAHVRDEVGILSAAIAVADSIVAKLSESLTRHIDYTREAEHTVDTVFQKKVAKSANAKYAAHGARVMAILPCSVHDVLLPVDKLLGRPVLHRGGGEDSVIEMLMREEFSADDMVFSSKYGGIESSLVLEWQFALEPRDDFVYPGQEGKMDASGVRFPARAAKKIDVFLQHEMALKAKLVRSEVIALRLYTGAAHGLLNDALRHTLVSKSGTESLQPSFLVTVTVLNSAITKLMRVTDPSIHRKLYRGLQNLYMADELFKFGPGSSAAFVERALASCSSNQSVALQYAGCCDCALRKDEEDAVFCALHKSTLLEISTGALDGGAWLGWVSQFPEEDEYCFAANSFFEVTGVRRERHVNVFMLSVRGNSCSLTLENLKEHRKNTILEFGASLLSEARQLLLCTPVAAQRLQGELTRLGSLDASFTYKYKTHAWEWFNSVENYQIAVVDVFAEWKAILESAVLSILTWLREQEEYESRGWSAAKKQEVLKMLEMALLIMQRCAESHSGATNLRVLRQRLAQFVLKYVGDLSIATHEVAQFWWEYAFVLQDGHMFQDALSAFQQDLALRRQAGAANIVADICRTLCRIGNLHRLMGDSDRASEVLQEAREHAQKLESKYHPVMADVAQGWALLHFSKQTFREALLQLEESLRIRMVHYTVQHQSVEQDLEHTRCMLDIMIFDKFTHRFRALERFFWIVTSSSNPHHASSDNDQVEIVNSHFCSDCEGKIRFRRKDTRALNFENFYQSVKAVVVYMQRKKMSAAAAEWGCRVLTAAVESLAEVPDIMGKVAVQAVLDVLCNCMQLFCGSALVQEAGLRAVVALCAHYPAVFYVSPATLMNLEPIRCAMSIHMDHPEILELGCRILRALVDNLEAAQRVQDTAPSEAPSVEDGNTADMEGVMREKTKVWDTNVLVVVAAAMTRHRGNVLIQDHACAVLLGVTRNSSASRRARIALQAKATLSETVRCHQSVQDIVGNGTECLKLLTDEHTAYEAFECRFGENNSEVHQLHLKVQELQDQVKFYLAERDRFSTAVATSDSEGHLLLSNLTPTVNAVAGALGSVVVQLAAENQRLADMKVSRKAKKAVLREQIQFLQHQLDHAGQNASEEFTQVKMSLENLQKEYTCLTETNSSLVAQEQALQAQFTTMSDEIAALKVELNETKHLNLMDIQEISALKSTIEGLQGELAKLKTSSQQLLAQFEEKQTFATKLTARRDVLEEEVSELKLEIVKLNDSHALDTALMEARQKHQHDIQQITGIADSYEVCLLSTVDAYEKFLDIVTSVWRHAEGVRESLILEGIIVKSQLESVLASLSSLEEARVQWAAEKARDAAAWAAEKARESARIYQIQKDAEVLVMESTELCDSMRESHIEIRDAGRGAVQKTMRGHWESGDTRAIIQAMLANPQCVYTQEIGCTTLWSLCSGHAKDEILFRIAKSEGVKAVMAAMDFLPDTLVAQESGCAIFCALAVNDDEVSAAIHEQGGVKSVVAALGKHWTSAVIVQHALGFLRAAATLLDYRQSMAGAVDFGAIVKSMRAFRGKALVAENGLALLAALLTVFRGNVSNAILGVPVPEGVVESMRCHPQNPVVQEHACDALHQLTSHGKSILDSELQTEAIRLLLIVVDTYKSNAALLPAAIKNLTHLTHMEKNSMQVSTDGGIARIVAILSGQGELLECVDSMPRNPSSRDQKKKASNVVPILISNCFALLQNISCLPTYLLIAREGAISAVIQTMIICHDYIDLQIEGCATLVRFAGLAANTVRIVEGNAVAVLARAGAAFPDSTDLQDLVLELLELLSDQPENVGAIIGQGGVEYILVRLKEEPEDDNARQTHAEQLTSSCIVLIKLAVHDEYRDAICDLEAISIILNGLRTHHRAAFGAPCVEEGLRSLMILAASANCQRAFGKAKGIDLIFEVFKSSPHAAAPGVLENGIGLLWNLAYDRDNLDSICEAGGVEWVLDTMKKYKEYPKLLEAGCNALWNFGCTVENQIKIARLGGIGVIVDSLRRWLHDQGLQESGRGALMRLPNTLLARVLEAECGDKNGNASESVFSFDRRSNRMGPLSASFLQTLDLDAFQWKGSSATERAISPSKMRPGPCTGCGGVDPTSSTNERRGGLDKDRSDIICFYCTHSKSRRVEVQFQDFRVSFESFSFTLGDLFRLDDKHGAVFVYSWMGVPNAVTDVESFHTCKTRIEDMYCGHGDQALSIYVYDHEQLASVMEAVTTATAEVQTGPELMPTLTRQDDSEYEDSVDDSQQQGKDEGQDEKKQHPDKSEADSAPAHAAASAPPPEHKLLGNLKLRHVVAGQVALSESLFPYYSDSTPESLATEAEDFVKSRNIPASHVPAIVTAALAKTEKALEAAKERGSHKKAKHKSKRANDMPSTE